MTESRGNDAASQQFKHTIGDRPELRLDEAGYEEHYGQEYRADHDHR